MERIFGMPALLEAPSPEASAALCAELGLSFVELNMNLPACQMGQLDASALLRLQDRYGVYFTLHLDEQFNPWDFNPRVSAAY